MPTLNLMNQQVSTDASGNATSVAPITSSTSDASGALSNVQTGTPTSITPPNPSQPVSTNQIVGGSPLNIPQGSPADTGSSLMSSINAGQGQTPQAPTPSSTPNLDLATSGDYTKDPGYQTAQGNLDTAQQSLAATENALPSQANLLSSAQQSTGATQDLTQVNQLNTQLAQANAAFNNASQSAETGGIQSGTPAVFYQGQQAAIQRQQAVVAGGIATQLQAAQGNYQAAEALAEKTAALQFADAQQKVNNLKDFVAMNQTNLTQAEKVAVSKMQAQAVQLQQQITDQKANVTQALQSGVTTQFVNQNGTFYNAKTGQEYSTPAQFFAASGVNSFEQAYQQGMVTDITAQTLDNQNLVRQARANYPDVNIPLNATPDQVAALVKGSRIYQKSVYIAPTAAQTAASGLTTQAIQGLVSTLSDYNGTQYVTPTDLTGYDTTQKSIITNILKQAGIPTLSAKDADALKNIQDAQSSLTDLQTALSASTIQPKGFMGRPIAIGEATLGSLFQVNNSPALDSFNASIIPLLSALKGTGSSGGGGAARLYNVIVPLLPSKTDTVDIANGKIANIQKLLDSGAGSIIKVNSTQSSGQATQNPDGTYTNSAGTFKQNSDGSYTRIK